MNLKEDFDPQFTMQFQRKGTQTYKNKTAFEKFSKERKGVYQGSKRKSRNNQVTSSTLQRESDLNPFEKADK